MYQEKELSLASRQQNILLIHSPQRIKDETEVLAPLAYDRLPASIHICMHMHSHARTYMHNRKPTNAYIWYITGKSYAVYGKQAVPKLPSRLCGIFECVYKIRTSPMWSHIICSAYAMIIQVGDGYCWLQYQLTSKYAYTHFTHTHIYAFI